MLFGIATLEWILYIWGSWEGLTSLFFPIFV